MHAYDVNWLIKQHQANSKLKYLYFWGHTPKTTGKIDHACLSQWYLAPFVVDNVHYPTAEHYMMAQKALLFDDTEVFNKIIHATQPKQAKELGRQVKNFDEKLWNEKRLDIVINGNLGKFNQNPALKAYLLSTDDKILVEASPVDKIWGVGLTKDNNKITNPTTWQGLNLLGFALMTVREHIICQNPICVEKS